VHVEGLSCLSTPVPVGTSDTRLVPYALGCYFACLNSYRGLPWMSISVLICLGTLVPNGISDVGLSLVPCLSSDLVVLTDISLFWCHSAYCWYMPGFLIVLVHSDV
jgi:hypothetical protein